MVKSAQKKMPHAYVIICGIIVFATLLTWILPAGKFDRALNEELGRTLVVPGSYKSVERTPVGIWGMFTALFDGMVEASDIIFFVIFSASYVFMLMKTGALNALTGSVLRKLGNKDYLIIPIFMIIFGIAGTTVGIYEEVYALIPVFVAMGITLGYDRVVGGAIVFVGVATGFAAAILNPFTIGIASGVAGIPLVGPKITIFRTIVFVLFMILSISYVMWYARKIRKDPTKSVMYGVENNVGLDNILSRDDVMKLEFTTVQKISVLGFVILIGILIWGLLAKGWYLKEIAALFFIFMIITGIINKMNANQIADTFIESSKSVLFGVLLIGLARGISTIMTRGNIIDTAVMYMSQAVAGLPKALTGIGMLVVQNIINFFITSGSGQAVVMMPIMAPLADVVGVSRELSVIAFQFGDGFSNMFWPTAAATCCGIMGVGLNKWYKFIAPLFLMMFCLQSVMIVAAVLVGI